MDNRSASGFTLVELMVTIALLAIFAAIAVPSYRNFVASNRAATEMNTFVADMQSARTAAIENGTDATVCVSTDGTSCAGSGNWSDGWIVFLDHDGDGGVDGSDQVLRFHAALPGGDSLTGNANVTDTITFNRYGMLAGGFNNGTITLHANPDEIAYRRCVVISSVGKLRAASGSDCP